ncbi:MAG: guanylate kinase [Anaeromicrobium sp.]|jgi:guanylate kinase|uniref:guanylate kinase n=1 Tax=Anaeromicrobium sp. TaxID=1929132 RepID=UPI0025E098D9|nr:guanylate kinase [Anaeromicrobium sp.]MCT4594906.1 guanylate kinase [Anaeromicrobium sp.]
MRTGQLIVISGPSGAGKGTVCKKLLTEIENLKISVSATTRNPREGEVDGINYHFTKKEVFLKEIEEDKFLEHAKVYDNYYGTPREYVMKETQKGNNVLLEIDIQGALQVKEKYPEGVFIFILPPSMQELKNRIVGRGTETAEAIEKRFKSAYEEIQYVEKYDYCVINDEVELAVERIKAIVTAETCKVKHDIEEIIDKFREEYIC